MYVEALVGPDTVDTMTPQTIAAFRDHGRVNPQAVTEGVDEAQRVLARLADIGIKIDEVTQRVLEAGVQSFADSYNQLLKAIARRLGAA
jgi:transaldolase